MQFPALPSLQRIAESFPSFNDGLAAVIINDSISIVSADIEIRLLAPHEFPEIAFGHIEPGDIKHIIGADCIIEDGRIEVSGNGRNLDYLLEGDAPELPLAPPESVWSKLPMLDHVIALLPEAAACWCDSHGGFTVAGAFSSAAITPYEVSKRDESYCAINIDASVINAVLKMDKWDHYCVWENRFFVKNRSLLVAIPHCESISGLSAAPLIAFCEDYKLKGSFKMNGSAPLGTLVRLLLERGRGIMDFSGGSSVPFSTDIKQGFELLLDDAGGANAVVHGEGVMIYIPDQTNQPVGFQKGRYWFWTVVIP